MWAMCVCVCVCVGENVFCADLSDEEDDDSSLQSQTTRSTDKSVPNGPNSKIGRNSRPNNAAANGGSDDAQWTGIGRGARGGPGAAVGQNVQRAVDTVVTGAQNAVGTVVTGAQTAVDTMIFGAKATADYMQYLTQALAQVWLRPSQCMCVCGCVCAQA